MSMTMWADARHQRRFIELQTKSAKMIGSTDARAFYCKAAYKLSENKMCVRAEIALKGREPAKYLLGLYPWNHFPVQDYFFYP